VTHRITSRLQFQAVMAGQTVAKTPHFALHSAPLSGQHAGHDLFPQVGAWLGVVLPKRWARRAVTRNAIKRQIYNVSEHFGDRLPVAAHVVRLRTTFDRKQFISATSEPLKLAVREELVQLFERAVRPEVRP
jgi:ribonuclease P protein component